MNKETPTFAAKYAMSFPIHSEITFHDGLSVITLVEGKLTKGGNLSVIASGSGRRSLIAESLKNAKPSN